MKPDDFRTLIIVLYILGGYIAAYRYARHVLKKVAAKPSSSSFRRAASWFIFTVTPLAAITALYTNWHDPFLPLLIGATMNVFWFYVGCLGVLSRQNTMTFQDPKQAREVSAKPLKSVYAGITIIVLVCFSFAIAIVLKVATPQTLARLLALVIIAAFVLFYRGLRATQR